MAVSTDIVIPSGKIFFDPFDSSGNVTGEIYMSQSPAFTLSVESEKIEVDDIDEAVSSTLFNVATKVTRTSAFSIRNLTDDIISWFMIANSSTVTQTTTPIVADPVNGGNGVTQGRTYQLGVSQNATGLRNLTSAAIKVGATTMAIETDYTIDLVTGRMTVVVGGTIADDDVVTADITPQAVSRTQLASHQNGPVQGALRFVSNNVRGPEHEYYMPQVTLNPSGDMDFKNRSEPLAAGFDVGVETKTGMSQIYKDGVAA